MTINLSFFIRLLGGCLLLLAAPLYAMQITLNVADITASGLAARGVRVVLAQDGAADLSIEELRLTEKIWRKVHVHCAEFLLGSVHVICRRGKLDAEPELSFEFGYNFSSQRLDLQIYAADNERWRANADFGMRQWHADIQLRNAQGRRLAPMLPPAWPMEGALNGTLHLRGDGSEIKWVNADLQVADLAFADASGLHAAKKLAGTLHLEATRAGQQWDWRSALAWQGGELLWQPLHLRGGYTLQASGQWDGARLQVTRAEAELAEVGRLELTALWDVNNKALLDGALRGNNLGLKRLFADFARPFLNENLLAESELTGRGDVDWQYHDRSTQALAVTLRDAVLSVGHTPGGTLPQPDAQGVSPPAWPMKGALNGTLHLRGDRSTVNLMNADLRITDLAFADASGLHAAEKLAGTLHLEISRAGQQWDWRSALAWQGGELFWQPLYLRGGYTLQASGQWDGARLQVTRAEAELAEIGRLELTALWDVNNKALLDGALRGNNLGLKRLFADFARPFLNESLLAESELTGRGDVDWQYRDGTTRALTVALRDAGLEDGQKRFTLRGVHAIIPWYADAPSQADVSFAEGMLWGAPIGATAWKIAMRGQEFSAAEITLPVFDGKLAVQDFHLHNEGGEWQWVFSGALAPVSMQKLSAALHWPAMHGTFSGVIPRVSYRDKTLKVDGALLFRVFDGTVVASSIGLFDPFGRMPRLSGNLDMRDLDLDLLTRTFSFGNIQGRIDLSVKGLDLVNWQPVRFDAKLASSPGEYRRKISQKAVQNISSLGGTGGAAALQRSYMSIFENFGYSRIGLSCVLSDDVCTMDGVEGDGSGAYSIVKGGGIPAINVLGYNRRVGWQELLTRLKRVLQDNMRAEIK